MSEELGPVLMLTQILYLYHEQTLKKEGEIMNQAPFVQIFGSTISTA